MILEKTLKSIEYDKIACAVSEHAVLQSSKNEICSFLPVSNIVDARFLLNKTLEGYKLLYNYNVCKVFFFENVEEQLKRVDMGGTLTIGDILRVTDNLKSARILKDGISSVKDESIVLLPEIASRLYTNLDFEKEIANKIISEDQLSDSASPKLYEIRKNIRNINARIREKLNSYMHGASSKYLQDGVVTMRKDRYVIPVKSEYRSFVKGFIHDQSSSGATVFIEPEQVMEYNNDLKKAMFDEAEEIHRILAEISHEISFMSDGIRYNAQNIEEIDTAFARAEYAFNVKGIMPKLNDRGIINIKGGRHPLIDCNRVVPITFSLGEKFNFLLITGPNTGGKTVTLKLLGLFTLMAESGIFVPALDGTELSIFDGVYTDIGDEQSIEQNLSTFSSHITNIKNILDNIAGNKKSLVLLDEIGAGTDPEEGSALALSIIEKLLTENAYGIITTHYSRLKEFAESDKRIENASMEFDAVSLKPMYKINVGIPGSSNAIEIAKVLGVDRSIIDKALLYLTDKKINFEAVLKKAEQTRREAEELKEKLEKEEAQKREDLLIIEQEKERIVKEREKVNQNAKQEVKRIVNDRLDEAEEIIDELKRILRRAGLESKEIFRAGELKNRLLNSKYLSNDFDNAPFELKNAKDSAKIGDKVYVKSLDTYAVINKIKKDKGEVEVLIGSIKTTVKLDDIFNNEKVEEKKDKVKVNKNTYGFLPQRELNVVGKTSLEALEDLKNFIDQAIVYNIEEIKVIHGVGEGILLKEIREYLKKDKNIKEFRRGKYGEGENGVTIITLK